MKKFLIGLLISFNAFAGQHEESVDKFDGRVTRTFKSTYNEFVKNDAAAVISLSNYNPADQTVILIVAALKPTECDKRYLELKTSDGVIHSLNATERDLKICFLRIPASYVKNSFTLRIPMFRESPVIAQMDTSTLDLNKLK